jgi:hypothetical protein
MESRGTVLGHPIHPLWFALRAGTRAKASGLWHAGSGANLNAPSSMSGKRPRAA